MEELNIKELIEKYPNTGKMLMDKMEEYLLGMQKQMIEEIPEKDRRTIDVPTIPPDIIMMMIEQGLSKGQNLEILFDLFDSNVVYMSIYYEESEKTWVYMTNINNYASKASSRKEGVYKCIPLAFEALENKLKTNV